MLRLPRLPSNAALVDAAGLPTTTFQQWWQQVVNAIEAQENQQDATISRIRRVLSHTAPTTILTASESGGSATIVVSDHMRIYGDATSLAVTGATITGLPDDVPVALYYDDDTLANPTPTIVATTDIAEAQAVAAPGRHYLGVIRTPPSGSGQIREGGGAYPAGSSIGGEVL